MVVVAYFTICRYSGGYQENKRHGLGKFTYSSRTGDEEPDEEPDGSRVGNYHGMYFDMG